MMRQMFINFNYYKFSLYLASFSVLIALNILLTSSCNKSEKLAVNNGGNNSSEEIPGFIPNEDDENNIIIQVTFNNNPKQANTSYTNLKFDKKAALNIEWDDNSMGSLDGLAIFKGGTASNGSAFPGYSFTDGCGNHIFYTAAVAINGYNHHTGKELGANYPEKITYNQIKTLIQAGWDIENHSLKHLSVASLQDAKNDISELNQLLFDRINYPMNTLVVPTNFNFFMKAAADLGFIAGTTQADLHKDELTLYPSNAWIDNVDLEKIPQTKFTALNRDFNDNWSDTENLKLKMDKTINSSSDTSNKLIRIGSHNTTNIAGFNDFIAHIHKIANDILWVTSMRELFEYRLAKELTKKHERLAGNTLTIILNQNDIPENIRWRDLSLKIHSEAPIANISIKGIDKYSFNTKTGLINIFSSKDYLNLQN